MNRMCHFIWWFGENHPNTLVFMPFKEWNTLEVDFVRFSPLTKRCSEKCLKAWLNKRKLLMPQNVFIGIRT